MCVSGFVTLEQPPPMTPKGRSESLRRAISVPNMTPLVAEQWESMVTISTTKLLPRTFSRLMRSTIICPATSIDCPAGHAHNLFDFPDDSVRSCLTSWMILFDPFWVRPWSCLILFASWMILCVEQPLRQTQWLDGDQLDHMCAPDPRSYRGNRYPMKHQHTYNTHCVLCLVCFKLEQKEYLH